MKKTLEQIIEEERQELEFPKRLVKAYLIVAGFLVLACWLLGVYLYGL